MTEMVEGGASLAWRLLATLEGGSLLLATSALLAYSARKRVAKLKRARRPIRTVLLTNTSNLLGKELQTRLEARGCVVHTLTEDVTSTSTGLAEEVANNISRASNATSETSYATSETSEATSEASEATSAPSVTSGLSNATSQLITATNYSCSLAHKVDALVVVGAFSPPKLSGLQGMAKLVSEDVYNNLKLLESLSSMVHRGGCLAWLCAGARSAPAAWEGAGDAFDMVLQANLHHIAKLSHCEPVWVGRCEDAEQAALKLVDALLAVHDTPQGSRFSIRNAAHIIGEYVGRWLKIAT